MGFLYTVGKNRKNESSNKQTVTVIAHIEYTIKMHQNKPNYYTNRKFHQIIKVKNLHKHHLLKKKSSNLEFLLYIYLLG